MAGIVIGAEDARMGEMREPWPVALHYCIIENHQMGIFLKIQNCCYAKCPDRERENWCNEYLSEGIRCSQRGALCSQRRFSLCPVILDKKRVLQEGWKTQ